MDFMKFELDLTAYYGRRKYDTLEASCAFGICCFASVHRNNLTVQQQDIEDYI